MNEITELAKIDFAYVFIAVLLILVSIKFAVSLFEWAVNILGLETKWMRQKREEHDLLMQTSQGLIELQAHHKKDIERSDRRDEEISNDIKKLTQMFVDKEINDYRWEIINLADKISSDKTSVSKECLRHAISTYEKYEKIIVENGLVNGEVEISIEIIKEAYQQKLKNEF
jgi:hypothetical protein